jgi:hypothetical protein
LEEDLIFVRMQIQEVLEFAEAVIAVVVAAEHVEKHVEPEEAAEREQEEPLVC